MFRTPYDIVRTILGLVLLTAGALKGYQLVTDGPPLSSSWDFQIVVAELFIGTWLISGLHPHWSWSVALVTFASFTGVATAKAAAGDASCGCLGNVQVSPWVALCLDVSAVFLLLRIRPTQLQLPWSPRLVPMTAVVLGLAAAFWSYRASDAFAAGGAATLEADGRLVGNGDAVVLDPVAWVGQRCPLLPHINVGDRLGSGTWKIVLIRRNCPRCHELISQYADSHKPPDSVAPQLAVVEIPIDETADIPLSNELRQSWLVGTLSRSKRWLCQTPTGIDLQDGRVIGVN